MTNTTPEANSQIECTVQRTDMINLLTYLGFKTARKMKPENMAKKAAKLSTLATPDQIDRIGMGQAGVELGLNSLDAEMLLVCTQLLLKRSQQADEEGKELVVDIHNNLTKKKPSKPNSKKINPKVMAKKAKAQRGLPVAASTEQPVAEAKPPRDFNSNEHPSAPGVRANKSRAYVAALVMLRHGLAAGITQEMVDEVNELYGTTNDIESKGRLRGAWHALRALHDLNGQSQLTNPYSQDLDHWKRNTEQLYPTTIEECLN
jgi:hypothetical protein